MATLDSRGLVNDGSANLSVAGNITVLGQSAMAAQVMVSNTSLVGSGSLVMIPQPGFYQVAVSGVAGQGVFTGSLPNAALFPGGDILMTDTVGVWPWMLTGSMSSFSSSGSTAGSQFMSSTLGTKMFLSPGSTIGFWSDSKSWLVCAVSGTATIKP